jgi:hypothetical protein
LSTRQFIVSLDYELFFGSATGSVEKSLLEPTAALAQAAERTGFKLTLFVDVGFLVAAARQSDTDAALRRQYDAVRAQLGELAARGHDLALHIHPHWEDCRWANGAWHLETSRYQLHDFPAADIERIVTSYQAALEEIKQAPVVAYRAGGWCLQPFEPLAAALKKAGVWLDSTVYPGGYSEVAGRGYDFRGAPSQASPWRFATDPLTPDTRGFFLEVPISACRYGPATFWRMAWQRLRKTPDTRPYGDGAVMASDHRYYARRLLAPTWSPLSIDGAKAALLGPMFRALEARDTGSLLNVMGHPKSVTARGVRELASFATRYQHRLEPVTLADFADRAPS